MNAWNGALAKRVSRRRTIGTAAAASVGAALLAACSSGGKSGSNRDTAGAGSSLLFTPTDTTKQAARGGVLQRFYAVEPTSYDPLSSSSQFTFFHAHTAYQRFFSLKPGTFNEPATGDPEGDAASSWEYSPDGLQLTIKLRPNNKLDPRAPTNGRVLNSGDVKWSWERFISLQPGRNFFSNGLSPDAPITSMTFPDENTVVVKLAFPMGALLKMFGTIYYFALLPIEAESQFDVRQDMRGSGAWMMTKYERSVGWEYRRNPNWFKAADRPFLDGLDYALLSDPSQILSQFEAKRLWYLDAIDPIAGFADVALRIKKDRPEAQMRSVSPLRGNGNMNYVGMSKLAASPFEKDVRLRQALSMLIDRDAYIEATNNVAGFRKEGLPIEIGWNTHVPCSWSGLWLDPQKNELGDSSKYLQFHPDEAAKLLRAAGNFGLEQPFTFAATGQFGTPDQIQILAQMFQEGGAFKLNLNAADYTTEITPKYTFGKGQYEGISTHPLGTWADWDLALWNTFTPSGRNDYVGHDTPELKQIMVRHRQELDPKKKIEIGKEWQKKMADYMVVVPFPGAATTFNLNWSWLGNAGWYETAGGGVASQETTIHLWYDKSKDTRASA